jgi:hypothetical protein
MPKVIVNQILNQLETLDLEELKYIGQAIQTYLADREVSAEKTRFHQALLTSGLVKRIRTSHDSRQFKRQLIQVQGQPISETIIEERR